MSINRDNTMDLIKMGGFKKAKIFGKGFTALNTFRNVSKVDIDGMTDIIFFKKADKKETTVFKIYCDQVERAVVSDDCKQFTIHADTFNFIILTK